MPKSLIERANQILKVYEDKEIRRDIKVQESLPLDDLINVKSEVEEELDKVNVMEITPLDALNILYKLKEKINNK
jgi:DNA mismatch repair protein MutS